MDAATSERDEIDHPRAQGFMLLSALLARPPDAVLLARLGTLQSDGSAWGGAIDALSGAARETSAEAADREYHRLFIGVSRGELVPYASYYLTGFLHDRPLVAVRRDMEALGIARQPRTGEPEDHVAALLEMMAGLIDGRFGGPGRGLPATLAQQRRFLEAHLASWAPLFFRDLQAAEAACFYRPVGALGLLLLDIEREAFGFD
jgi:TorA maturation chaperone TorD